MEFTSMVDIIDQANELELLNINVALMARKQEKLNFIGMCHYCQQPLLSTNFCDEGCRDDYEKELKLKPRRNGELCEKE
jgi:hypothetical protein